MSYLRFVQEHRRFLGFGFVLMFFSGFGQTFLVSLYSEEIRSHFSLSHGGFGGLYSAATLASGLTVLWAGRIIDRVRLERFTLAVAALLVAACTLLALSPVSAVLVLGLYGVRLGGQGLMTHTAMTSMARYFDSQRGKASAVALLGLPVAQTVLPSGVVASMERWGWRESWAINAVVCAVVLVPAVLWLLRGHAERHRQHTESLASHDLDTPDAVQPQWTRGQVIRDLRFYLALPAATAPAFLLTGFLFHQVHLAHEKGWSLEWLAACFIGFSLAQITASFSMGSLVDRFGAKRLFSWQLAPLAAGLALLAVGDHPALAVGYMALVGLSAGASGAVNNAVWAEAYGVLHLGAIRSLISAVVVLSTSIAPFLMGGLLDVGITFEQLAAASVMFCGLVFALGRMAFGKTSPL